MGIPGLKSYIDNCGIRKEKDLTAFLKESDHLVIDGNNLHHFLFNYSNRKYNAKHGGDYDLFASDITKFFRKLEDFDVLSYVVFDGFDRDQSEGRLRRVQDRLEKNKELLEDDSTDERLEPTLSCLATTVLMDCLNKQAKVKVCVVDGDGDPAAFSLSHYLRCPLVSDDSDFLLSEIVGGVVGASELIKSVLENSEASVPTIKIYFIDEFVENYNKAEGGDLQKSALPLLSITWGCERLPADLAKAVQHYLEEKRIPVKNGSSTMERRVTIVEHIGAAFSLFCRGKNAVINGIDQTTISDEDVHVNGLGRERDGPGTTVGQQIEEIIRGYYYQPGHWIEEFFTAAGEIRHDKPNEGYKVLSEQLWRKYRTGQVPTRVLKLFFGGEEEGDTLHPLMENVKCDSAWQCSFKIRLLLYNTVKDMVDTYNTVPGAPPMAPILSIPVRERHYEEVIHRSQLLRGTGISRDGASLATVMERLDLTVGQQRACQSVLAEQGDNDKKVALMMTIIFCWVNNAKPAVSKRNILAAMKCMDEGVDESKIDELTARGKPNVDVIHSFAQLSAVIYDLWHLLELVEVEDFHLDLPSILKGSLYHQLCVPSNDIDDTKLTGWREIVWDNVKDIVGRGQNTDQVSKSSTNSKLRPQLIDVNKLKLSRPSNSGAAVTLCPGAGFGNRFRSGSRGFGSAKVKQ